MNWIQFLKRFVINILVAVIASTVFFGGIGLLLAGTPGMLNLGNLGLLLGLIGGVTFGAVFCLKSKDWGGLTGGYATWWLKRETEGYENQFHGQEDYSQWKL